MGDEIQIISNVTTELAKEVYSDVAKPILQPTGKILGLLPQTILACIAPLEEWIIHKNYNVEKTKKLLEEKLKNIPPENLETPEIHIGVPALQYISYCMDNEELRNMYANLLANSMNKVVKNGVHPSFVEIIKQLCPDEAKILKYISKEKVIPTLTIRAKKKEDKNDNIETQLTTISIEKYTNFSIVGEQTKCEKYYDVNKYFDNLIRLGLLNPSPKQNSLSEKDRYEPLKKHYFIDVLKNDISDNPEYNIPIIQEGYMQITNFGYAFCKICIEDPSDTK